ncbi:MAG: Eco57I restriction-modification methylase domain-containing protein [Oscillospiraceae bacterium]
MAYRDTFAYKLIYVMTIPDEDHKGLLKIGEATLASFAGESQLPPNCEPLNAAAHKRIKEYTHTAMVRYELLYTELAIRHIVLDDGSQMLKPFSDNDIQRIVKRAGFFCKTFYDTGNESEWFAVDLETVKNAIKAFKEGRSHLSPSEKPHIDETITLRTEQRKAVENTLSAFRSSDHMLWNCKMRFGKTVSAYDLIKRGGYQKSIVVTHRPVVVKGWREDHDKIFGSDSEHIFVTKQTGSNAYEFDAAIDAENERMLRAYVAQGISFTYFASMQDLRGSELAGGKFEKNKAVFDIDWDLIIYDEAHEGTQTDPGKNVRGLLETPKNGKHPRVLSLSGTPYNIENNYSVENTYTWDYVMEQRRKREYALYHPDEPNPYADLPELRIYTFDLQKSLLASYRYVTEDMAFNFREFFRTWTGNPKKDFRPIPSGRRVGDFVHEDDVVAFLDLISADSDENNYPFSNAAYRNMFRHTFWIVPGVNAAAALSKLLKRHPVFKQFKVANVAGAGDEEEPYDEALKKVQDAIANNKYTITLSCGRLTTGVTVPEWSAVMLLTGGANASAAGYMQTIFRVQSAGSIDGKQKECAYAFDFAPDRALNVISEVHDLTRHGKMSDEQQREALGEFLNFCPVIAVEGTQMLPYKTESLMRQIKKISVDKAVNTGFDDDSIYNEGVGIVMDGEDVKLFNKLAGIVHGQSKAKPLPKKVTINSQGLTNEQYEIAEKAKNKPKRERTPEEEAAIKKQQELKKEREKVLRLLRAVSIRLPLLIYGMRKDVDEDIPMEEFVKQIDPESWSEFMPKGVTKDLFLQLLKYYDRDVVSGAGFRIRRMARAADELPPLRRAMRIAEIISHFRNPDKETVLTPWRVVNMHMSDTIGGYCFFDEDFDPRRPLDEPRLVENGDVTANIFCNPDAHLLEMNSKSGLYPLYLACSIYLMKLSKPEDEMPLEETQRIWREIVSKNIFVFCRTKMACSITRRTLVGYQDEWTVHAINLPRLLDWMNDKVRLAHKLSNPEVWKIEGERLKFDAIVGNPPYQLTGGSGGTNDAPIYQEFAMLAEQLEPEYTSLIMPARWFSGGRESQLAEFRQYMLNNKHIRKMTVYTDSKTVFPTVEIKGGLCYYLIDKSYNGQCKYALVQNGSREETTRNLGDFDIIIRNPQTAEIVAKVMSAPNNLGTVDSLISGDTPFGIPTNPKGSNKFRIDMSEKRTVVYNVEMLYFDNGARKRAYINADSISKNAADIFKEKVFIPKAAGSGVDPYVIGKPEYGSEGSVCSQTFLYAAFNSKEEAKNFETYLKTKFFRLLVSASKISQETPSKVYRFVPIQDFTKPWTDAELYAKYNLTAEEVAFIEAMIKPME